MNNEQCTLTRMCSVYGGVSKEQAGMKTGGIKSSGFRFRWSSVGLDPSCTTPWGCYLMSLNFTFLILKIGIKNVPTS